MRYRVGLSVSALLVALALLSGCTSSGKTDKSTPATTRPPSSAQSSGTVSSTPAAPTSSSTKPAPTSTAPTKPVRPAPLSAFEKDPAVQAMRKFFYHSGRMINAGNYIDAELRTMITPFLVPHMKQLAGVDVGRYYPGPLPFQPKSVQVVNSTNRTISGCLIANGWAQNPKTHRPAKPLQVVGAKVFMVKGSGRWLVNAVPFVKSVSCKGVVVHEQKWSSR